MTSRINPLLDPNTRLVIAHRGNVVAAPENTIEALRQAAELGADALEVDVRAARDGTPVLMHDASLDRTTNGHGCISTFTVDELQSLNAAARFAPRGESRPASIDRHRIPALEEVLDLFRETPLVIDVKEVAVLEAVERLVRRFGAESRVLMGSSHNLVMGRLYRSGLRTCASTRDALRIIPAALAGLTPVRPVYDVLSITTRFRGLAVPVTRMAAAARRAGVPTHVWTVNERRQAGLLWAAGVSGIVTDDPAAIIEERRSKAGA